MACNGVCVFCSIPCFRGEVKTFTPQEEERLSEVFDNTDVSSESKNGLAVVENIGTYEVVRNIFGKEKVRKVN